MRWQRFVVNFDHASLHMKIQNSKYFYQLSLQNKILSQIFLLISTNFLVFYQQVSMQMQSESNEKQSSAKNQKQTEARVQILPEDQSSVHMSDDQKIKRKVQLQLYLHFEHMLGKSPLHYNKQSNYYDKHVSKQQIINETVEYLNYFEENIDLLPPQHNQQLLLLIDYFNNNKELITNRYFIPSNEKDSIGPAKFCLAFNTIKKRIDLKKFLSINNWFDNWNHLLYLRFWGCGWLNNDDWREFVMHANNFQNLEWLNLSCNKIKVIKKGDINKFKSLKWINLCKLLIKTIEDNPLNKESKEVVQRLKQNRKQMTIYF